ncbi:MAG: spherulation-specific family 4 protein [Thermomicrobiales bacterium]|nr:spherulation-specific family 4 protein [Thermomicrobiales bacterium]
MRESSLSRSTNRRRVLALAAVAAGSVMTPMAARALPATPAAAAPASATPAATPVATPAATPLVATPVATAACPRIIVPAYFPPGPEWERIIAAAPVVEYVILNIHNGPGREPDPAFQDVVRRAQAAGIKVLGYVYTDMANENAETLKQQIRDFQTWYRVDGIHLDGAQDDDWAIPYYRDIAQTIKVGGQPSQPGGEALPGVVMLNPGYTPDEGFMEFVDLAEVYEYYYGHYLTQEFPGWLHDYPADRFLHVVRDVPDTIQALDQILDLARQRNAGYVYITDHTDPLDYKKLPSFWDAQVASLCS